MQDFGLFLSDDDSRQGVWLEPARKLDYYLLRNGDLLEYRRKLRHLRVRMLDGSVKTLLLDDSQPVACLMVVICTKIGKNFIYFIGNTILYLSIIALSCDFQL